MKRVAWRIVPLVGLVLLAAVGLRWWLLKAHPEPRPRPESILAVHVVQPQHGGLQRICTQPATVESWERVDLFAQVTGVLTGQTVDINSKVEKDQVLAQVDCPDLVKELDLARAVLIESLDKVKKAEAQLEATQAQCRAAQQTVARRQAEVIAAGAYVKFRDIQLQRVKDLVARQTVENDLIVEEQDRHEAARYRKDGAALAVEQAQEDVKAKEAEVQRAQAQVEFARTEVNVAQKAVDKAQVYVDFTHIKAPFRGIVTHRGFNNGAFLRAKERGSQTPLLSVQRTDKFRVVTYVPAGDVPFLRVGDPAELRLPTLGITFKGTVARRALSQSADNRLMRTEMDLTDERGVLRDGMYGEISIQIGNVAAVNPDVVTVPSVCLQDEGQAKEGTVYVVRPAGSGKYKIHALPVLVGYNQDHGKLNARDQRREDLRVEILQGLSPEDLVVFGQLAAVHEGSVVTVKE
jgi:HlyD family secretion protein